MDNVTMETHFTLSLVALGILRQCMEEAFAKPRMLAGYLCHRDWKEEFLKCLECLDQAEGRAFEVADGDVTILMPRVNCLLHVAARDDWSSLPVVPGDPQMVQLRGRVTDWGSMWRDFHARVGRYHKEQFARARLDLGELCDAWDRKAPESLPLSAWLHCVETQVGETLHIL